MTQPPLALDPQTLPLPFPFDPWEQPQMQCPKCLVWMDDFDGFGVLAHLACGYCTHFDCQGDGTCNVCGYEPEPFTQKACTEPMTPSLREPKPRRRTATDDELDALARRYGWES